MSELLPPVQARAIRDSLVDYLTTTFALSDADARDGLDQFLSDPATGMFKGPYVRLRLPFRTAEEGWRDSLEWYEGFMPYGHQAAAFARLSSSIGGVRRRPQPTLVTTGTGSGKTEAFMFPIVDHVLRARRDGVTGTKALILYPMNALAYDQATRLARLLTSHQELSAITAGLYVGDAGERRTTVTPDGLITDRGVMQDEAPDILLTNYKMLDQLLLRADDQGFWRQSAASLQYLVLDEFHTYDGAQGTDVAMLLRRLGLALKSYWHQDDPTLTDEDWARPLGKITPVATSATLGEKGDPEVMTGFATTVFGEVFGHDAVITESRLGLDEWVGSATAEVAALGLAPVDAAELDVAGLNHDVGVLGGDPDAEALAWVALDHLYGTAVPRDPEMLLSLSRAHPIVQTLAGHAGDAVELGTLVADLLGPSGTPALAATGSDPAWERALAHIIAMLGHVRAVAGLAALSVDVHLWVRELTRIDRAADPSARFRWGDDGPPIAGLEAEDARPSFPAIYCRHCGRSGWQVALAPVGHSLATEDSAIRREHAAKTGRTRALLFGPAEADAAVLRGEPSEGLVWFAVRGRELQANAPSDDDPDLRDGWILPVLTTVGQDADKDAKDDTCPSCGRQDAIRFLGSAIATLLSVSLSTLFGSATLSSTEKKTLVFTDSVQDAAHRAGFVQARSHTLTLRGVLRDAVAEGGLSLDVLVEEAIQRAGDDRFARYRLLAPDCADRESFTPFWSARTLREVPAKVRNRARNRLALDASLEFGLNSRTGRTLEATGAVAVDVEAGPAAKLAVAARAVLQGFAIEGTLDDDVQVTDSELVRWVRGVLDRMRTQGAIDHPWFVRYRQEDGNRWSIWGGRPRQEGMPAFPKDRPAPAYPRVGGVNDAAASTSGLDAVTSPKSWYARWTSRALPVSSIDGGRLVRLLLDRLAKDGLLGTTTTKSGATVYALSPSAIVVQPTTENDLASGRHLLVCDTCHTQMPGGRTTVDQLEGAPCLLVRCAGHLERASLSDGFYRRLYSSTDTRRIVAREHTSMLDDETRQAYEEGFKSAGKDPQAPNVLVATPTLEMGIDIGDLSTVLLSSLPRTVASYLQRVGRAGRLTGNALNLAYVTGRGDQLPKLGEPLSVINGEVRPPATYLQAEEILRRQYTAYLVDEFARDPSRPHPRKASGAIGSSSPGSFLGDLIAAGESGVDEDLPRFLGAFPAQLSLAVTQALAAWLRPEAGAGTSEFAAHVHAVSGRWQSTIETLKYRRDAIDKLLPELEAKAASSAKTEEDEWALRSAKAARKLTLGQLARLSSEYWIGVLEEYGLLPNYTLLDDTVTLDVGLSWVDPDTGQFETGHAAFHRASALAIRDFAPGATFYARGWEIAVDAVDLGLDGEAIRPWVFCPACGFAIDVATGGTTRMVASCPRCGSTGTADTGQRFDIVELSHVTSEVRRDEVMISDRYDEREVKPFQVVTAADVDPAQIVRRWFVDGVGLGCTYLRAMDLRWVNLGTLNHGLSRVIAGDERTGALFRVCAGCGKLDTDTGRNRPYEHRPWCPYRDAPAEVTRTVALSRTLRTQGLVIRLPHSVTIGDMFAVPSLAASVLLGLREQVGGHPDHLHVVQIVDPVLSDGSDNHEALLVHDLVPGGTGYLAEMADPARLRDLLVRAWDRVRTCECRNEERLACHRCLLPFAGNKVALVSRASAERHLRALLGLPAEADSADAVAWQITEVPPTESPESHLEQRFRKVLTERLKTSAAAITEVPGPWGNTVRFTLPGGPRQWSLTPQVNVANSKPDFLLESTDTTVPRVAIFTDGRMFHAVPAHNRLADDAAKRTVLRDAGYVVLAVTAQDVEAAENKSATPPEWFSQTLVGQLIQQPQFVAKPSAYETLKGGPIDWLMDWVTAPAPTDLKAVARAVPLFLNGAASLHAVPADTPLADLAATVLCDLLPDGESDRKVAVWRSGALVVLAEPRSTFVDVAAVLDDRDEALTDTHAPAWRAWLHLSNALALRDWPTTVTTLSLVESQTAAPAAAESEPLGTVVPAAWVEALAASTPGAERGLLMDLVWRPGVSVPLVGAEGPDGIPLDISWPDAHLVVETVPMPTDDRRYLESVGWHIVPPDVDAILVALAVGGRDESKDA